VQEANQLGNREQGYSISSVFNRLMRSKTPALRCAENSFEQCGASPNKTDDEVN
jgi:hypothetical protein